MLQSKQLRVCVGNWPSKNNIKELKSARHFITLLCYYVIFYFMHRLCKVVHRYGNSHLKMCGGFPEIRVSRDERRRLLLFCLTPVNEQRDFTSQMYDFSEKVNSVGAVYSVSGFLQRIWERQWIWKTSLISSPHHVGFHKGPNHLPEWKLTTTSCLFPGRSFPVRPRSSRLRHVFCSPDRHHVTTSRDRILSVSQPILCQARRDCSGDLSGGCWFVWSQLMRRPSRPDVLLWWESCVELVFLLQHDKLIIRPMLYVHYELTNIVWNG